MITSGRTGVVYYVDTSTPSIQAVDEAMTSSGDGRRYYITDQAKRYWDPSKNIVVKANGVVASGYVVEYCGGHVVFTSPPTPPVTVSTFYWPYARLGQCRKWTLKYKPSKCDVTVLLDQARRRLAGVGDVEATLEAFYEDATWFNFSIVDKLLGLVLHETGTYTSSSTTGSRYEMYAHVDVETTMNVDDAERCTLNLVGEGPLYYRSV